MLWRNLDYAAYALAIVLFVAAIGLHREGFVERTERQSRRLFIPGHVDVTNSTTLPYETFSGLGIQQYAFVGDFGNETYQASLWIRYACRVDAANREVRVVLTINQLPYMFTNPTKSHAMMPPRFGINGTLPRIYFEPRNNKSKAVDITMQTWEHLLKEDWRTSAFNGDAVLSMSSAYLLHMQGSERIYEIPEGFCTRPNKLIKPQSVWLGTHEKLYTRPPKVLEFVYMEHLKHHLKLGFDGMLWVVRWETLRRLQQDRQVVQFVRQKKLVLIAWEYGLVEDIAAFMQVPGYNLLRLALYGVERVTLGLWDPDEYLLLPRHRSIKEELYGDSGCLRQVHTPEAEAVIPISYGEADLAITKDLPDYTQWISRGSVPAAIRQMNYYVRDTQHCNYGIYCKALINPSAPYNFHVHQFTRGPTDEANNRVPVPRNCSYMVHFHRMWVHRGVWDESNALPPEPLRIQDFPAL